MPKSIKYYMKKGTRRELQNRDVLLRYKCASPVPPCMSFLSYSQISQITGLSCASIRLLIYEKIASDKAIIEASLSRKKSRKKLL